MYTFDVSISSAVDGTLVTKEKGGEEVRWQATYVTGSNEEDGFAGAVERYVLPRAVPAPPWAL